MAERATLTVSNHETKCFVRWWPMPLLCPRGNDLMPLLCPRGDDLMPLLCPRGDDRCPYYVPEAMTDALIMSQRRWPMPLLCPRGNDRCPYYVPEAMIDALIMSQRRWSMPLLCPRHHLFIYKCINSMVNFVCHEWILLQKKIVSPNIKNK